MPRRRKAATAAAGKSAEKTKLLVASSSSNNGPLYHNHTRRLSLKDSGHGNNSNNNAAIEERLPLISSGRRRHDNNDNDDSDNKTLLTAMTSSTSITATPIIEVISRHTGLPHKATYILVAVILILFLIWFEGYRINFHVNSSQLSKLHDISIPKIYTAKYSHKPHLIDPSWPGHINVNFETLVPPSEIDLLLQRRLPVIEEGRECDDILLYMPHAASDNNEGDGDTNHHGGGIVAQQLNNYLMAVMLSTFTSKAMVLLEPKEDLVPGGSQFGCPSDAFDVQSNDNKGALDTDIADDNKRKTKQDFPKGLSLLIRHSDWLSRGCNIPCQSNHDYEKWMNVRKRNENSKFVQHTTCRNDSGWESRVLVVNGNDVQRYFENNFKGKMLHRPSPTAYNWALRLGAKKYEAQVFANLEDEEDIWDYISALLARSDVLRFQPWIGRDVKTFIRSSQIPMQVSYDAFHVRREKRGIQGFEMDGLNVIPFQEYLHTWERHDCSDKARIIYIASDNPGEIKKEISNYPFGNAGNLILPDVDECHGLRFYLREDWTSTEVTKKGSLSDCSIQYRRTVSSIADLIILAKSSALVVGEFGTGFARLVRNFRAALNDYPAREDEGVVLVRDTRVVWGKSHPGPPGI